MKILFTISLVVLAISARTQETFQSFSNKAQQEFANENYQQAIDYYQQAMMINGVDSSNMVWTASLASICASYLKDDMQLIKYNNIAIEFGSQDLYLIDKQLKLAEKYKDSVSTEKVLRKARNIEGKYKKYSQELMLFYFKNKSYNKTINIADDILVVDSDNINALNYKGMSLHQTGKEPSAMECFKTVLDIDPENLNANIQMGMILYNKGKMIFDTANKDYEKLKSPTALEYHEYKKEIRKSKPYYQECLPFLQRYNSIKNRSDISAVINKAKSRIEDMSTKAPQ